MVLNDLNGMRLAIYGVMKSKDNIRKGGDEYAKT